MESASLECRPTDARAAQRASIFLGATLYCDGVPSPAKIRNLSATGALVECSSIPAVDALVQLVRGGLIVHALVAWRDKDRCGLKFSGSVDVQQWRTAPTNREQQRVDEVVSLIKAGAVPLPVPPLAEDVADRELPLSADLRRASGLLENLGEALAEDPDVVTRHGHTLQNLDIAMQLIDALQSILAADQEAHSDVTKLAGLRRSADQALLNRR